jgi:hypothetical protein
MLNAVLSLLWLCGGARQLVEVYKALALGTAEFPLEHPMAIISVRTPFPTAPQPPRTSDSPRPPPPPHQRTLPDETGDPSAPYPFFVEPRLDVAGFANRTVATNFVSTSCLPLICPGHALVAADQGSAWDACVVC